MPNLSSRMAGEVGREVSRCKHLQIISLVKKGKCLGKLPLRKVLTIKVKTHFNNFIKPNNGEV